MEKKQKAVRKPQLPFLPEEVLQEWLDALAQTRTLIAPREVSGVLLYQPVTTSKEISWGFTRPLMSAKELFFPPTEHLFTIEKTGQDIHLNEILPEGETVLFGVRPCDARGVALLDALFLKAQPADPYYASRRAHTAMIGLACNALGPTCFCTSTGGAPDEARDMDVMLYQVDGGYALEALTVQGKALTADLRLETSTDRPGPVLKQSSESEPPRSIPWPEHFTDSYWARMSERCLSCRVCAYVCPTCRCFAVRDEATLKPGEFERIRCWDSCTGENYRRIAGGHKPRPEKSERLRNRFFCKFYYYPEQYSLGGTPACTGCGRCVDVCPVGVDITEVLMDLGRPA